MIRYLAPAALGIAALAPAAVAANTVQEPWGTVCHLSWCQSKPTTAPPIDAAGLALKHAADVAKAKAGCRPARPGDLPATMVLTSPTGAVTRVTWTYPAPAGYWVEAVCR